MPADKTTVFIEATEWGEILALSGSEYLQGVEYQDGQRGGNDSCGQSTVYCFVQELHDAPQESVAPQGNPEKLGFGDYSEKPNAWELIWTYRRIRGEANRSLATSACRIGVTPANCNKEVTTIRSDIYSSHAKQQQRNLTTGKAAST